MSHTVSLFAPAKINLFLHVTGRRPDGYHTLQSLMGFVDIGDALEFSAYDSLYIDVTGPFAAGLENPKDNLVYKAALLLSEHYKVPAKAKITLTKNLPVASGIGGGSSDAAATLAGLVKLWNLRDEPDKLQKIALQLGADVPACLHKKTVWAEGIGEKITRIPEMPELFLVLVNPLVPTPTTEVFKKYRERFSPPIQFSGRRKSAAEWIADLKIYRNDLTDAAIAVTPQIREALAALADTPGCLLYRLSGSGATCFGIYNNADSARVFAHVIQERNPDWWVVTAKLLP